MNDYYLPYYSIYTSNSLIKYKPKPAVLHHKTCPICDRKLVNVYYTAQLDKYVCKRCIDNLIENKGDKENG